jgi:hypothetical protein
MTTKSTLVYRAGRTFKVDRGRSGDATGWIVYERGLEPGVITWSPISGAHRLKTDAYADIDRWIHSE